MGYFMHKKFMDEAIKEAEISLSEGGIPIGAVLVKDNEVISRGHNRLIQNNSVILHGEMDAIENAKGLDYDDYRKCTLYTTLSPCPMCSGAVLLYNIPRVVIGDNTTLMGAENLCNELFESFVNENPGVWEKELAKVGNTTELKK